MAKPLSPKSKLIREAINANPNVGNTKLAELINGSDDRKQDKIKISAGDVNQQRQALKALNGKPKKKPKPHKAATSKAANQPEVAQVRSSSRTPASPVELIDRVFDLAQACGGFAVLKRMVDRIAAVEGR
jgi:hypothetical protein